MIEKLKANLLSIIAEFYHLLTKGSNVAQDALLNCISGSIIILYVLLYFVNRHRNLRYLFYHKDNHLSLKTIY